MASLAEIRDRVKVLLAEGAGAAGLTVLPRVVKTTPPLPAALLRPVSAEFASKPALRGMSQYSFQLMLFVAAADIELAEVALEKLLEKGGPIRAPFEREPHLGFGGGTSAWIDGMDYGVASPWAAQETDVLGASLRLEVKTTG